MKNRLLLSVCYLYISMLPAQKLDYSSHIALEVAQQTLHLYADANNAKEYYFMPYPSLFRFGRNQEGFPEFLFLRYTSDDDHVEGGALFHCLIQWQIEDALVGALQKALNAKVPTAILKGIAPLGTESKFYIVSGMLDKREIITSGQGPVLPGSKMAVSMRLDRQIAELMYEQIKRGAQTDLSFVFEYKIPFQAPVRDNIVTIDWQKYRLIYARFSKVILTSIHPEQDGFAFLLKEGVLSFAEKKSPETTEYLHAQIFLMKYLKDVQPEDARANRVAMQRINMTEVPSGFLLPLQISVNMGDWTDEILSNPECVSTINLNDPDFQTRNISIMLDYETERLFKGSGANYLSVEIEKDWKDGYQFNRSIIFSKSTLANGKNIQTLIYPRLGSDNWLEYRYKYSWSLRGLSTTFPKEPIWITTSEPVIAIPSPVQAVDLIVDASDETLKRPELRAVTLDLSFNYLGSTGVERIILKNTGTGLGIATKTIFCDKENPNLNYRFVFLTDKGTFKTDQLPAKGETYFIPILPDVMKQ